MATPRFGGWHSYRAWADHDFVPCPAPGPRDGSTSGRHALGGADTEAEDDHDDLFRSDPPGLGEHTGTDYYGSAPAPGSNGVSVRPYVMTGGRTNPGQGLDLHALILAQPGADLRGARANQRTICQLCTSAHSVAEVAALTHVPLGVARVLIDDLISAGLLTTGSAHTDSAPSADLMSRVLRGLRRL